MTRSGLEPEAPADAEKAERTELGCPHVSPQPARVSAARTGSGPAYQPTLFPPDCEWSGEIPVPYGVIPF